MDVPSNIINNIPVTIPQSTSILDYINSLSSSKYFIGLVMILMNIGGRYIELDIAQNHRKFLNSSKLFKRILIFTIAFMATRDIVVAFIITAAFIVFVMHLFNDESDYCILPKNEFNKFNIDTVSPEEIKVAYEKLKKAGKII